MLSYPLGTTFLYIPLLLFQSWVIDILKFEVWDKVAVWVCVWLSSHMIRSKTNIPQQKVWLRECKERMRLVGVWWCWTAMDTFNQISASFNSCHFFHCLWPVLKWSDHDALLPLKATPFTVRMVKCPHRYWAATVWKALEWHFLFQNQSLCLYECCTITDIREHIEVSWFSSNFLTYLDGWNWHLKFSSMPDTNLHLWAYLPFHSFKLFYSVTMFT